MAEVVVRNLTKYYGDVIAIDSITMHIHSGELLAVVGPSGCGKTTLLRCIAGLEMPSAGEVAINGRIANELSPRERDVAMVFQEYALYPHLNVRGNLEFPLRMRRMKRKERDAHVRAIAEMLRIHHLLDRYPNELSGGERQRVALGRALMRQPKVLLLDEPFANMDVQLRAQMRTELLRIHRRIGTTIIYVTHDQSEAMSLGERVAVLSAGKLQQLDTPERIYRHPVNIFVAQFIGSPPMNIWCGSIAYEDNCFIVRIGELCVLLPAEHNEVWHQWTGQRVLLGIRPEDVELHSKITCEGASHNWVTMQVELIEPLGNEYIVHGRTFPNGLALTALRRAGERVQVGQILFACFHSKRVHLFDASTGATLL